MYLTSLLSLSTMSVLSSGVVMNMIHQDDDKPVPKFLRCLVCCRRRQIRKDVSNGSYRRRLPPPLIEHKSVAGFGIVSSQSTSTFSAPSQRRQQTRNSSAKRQSLHKNGNGSQEGGELKQVQEGTLTDPYSGQNVPNATVNTTGSGGLPTTTARSDYRWSNGDTSRNRQHPTSPNFDSKAELRRSGGGGRGGEIVGVSPITIEGEKYPPGFPREAVIRYESRADGGKDEHYIVTDEESEEREALFDRAPGRGSRQQADLNPDDWSLVTWMDVGSAVDTILFWVFLGITVTSTAIVLILFSAQ